MKKLNLKSKIQVFIMLSISFIIISFIACEKENDKYPTLKVVNQTDATITGVNLVGYDFNTLSITKGNSQTFILNQGMSGGYSNINVKVNFRYGYARYLNTTLNFSDGEITIVTLKSNNNTFSLE